MSDSVVSNDAPTPSQPASRAPSVVSADRPAADQGQSHSRDASNDSQPSPGSDQGGEEETQPVIKTAEQRELEALRRQRTRQERVNARLWQENQQFRARQPQSGEASQPRQQDDTEERVQVSRKDFESAVEARARQAAQAMSSEEKLAERCNTLLDKGNAKDPGFDKALVAVGSELPMFDAKGQPTDALEEILDSKRSVEIILHLRDNPDVAAELAELSPRQLTRRLVALEGQLAPQTRQVSTAPRPLEPERPAASPAEPDPGRSPAAWRKWRNETSKVT